MSDDRAKIAVAFTPEESYAVKVAVSQLQEAKLKEGTFDDNLGKALGEVWQKVRAAERKGMPTIVDMERKVTIDDIYRWMDCRKCGRNFAFLTREKDSRDGMCWTCNQGTPEEYADAVERGVAPPRAP